MSFNIRLCLIDSFKAVAHKSDEPLKKTQARIGVSLLILGIVLTILGVVFTALLLAGALPSLSPFIFAFVSLIGMNLAGIGAGILLKRYKTVTKIKYNCLKMLHLKSSLVVLEQAREIDRLSLIDSGEEFLSKSNASIQYAKKVLKAYKAGLSDFKTAKSKLLQIFVQCKSNLKILKESPEKLIDSSKSTETTQNQKET